MFIESVQSEYVTCVEGWGSGVMTSAIDASLCSLPPGEPTYSTGYLLSRSPSFYSQSGHTWSSASCSKPTSMQHLNCFDDGTATGTVKPQSYTGVRVKNPVKELIMQKYRDQRSWSSNYQNQDNALCPEPCCDVSERMLQLSESGPVSMTTAHMPGTWPQTAPPRADPGAEMSPRPAYLATDPGISVAMGAGFYIPPLTPQPDAPPPLPPPQSLSLESPGGVSFFQWQIRQEEEKVARLMPAQLVAQDSDGDTLLHIAVAQGRRALSYVLARNMARLTMLDLKDHNGQSALQVSVAANQHLIVQDLIAQGAQINTIDCWGRTPLHVCAEKGHGLTMQAIHKALGATGQKVNIEAVNYDGITALHTAVLSHNAALKDSLDGSAAQTQALLQRRKQLEECIRTLLLMGASCRSKDHKSGRTSLHMAAEEANVELLLLFLDQPDSLAIVNSTDYTGHTPLHVASALTRRVTQVDAVRLLMKRGADPSMKNLEKEQPSQLVAEGPVGDMVGPGPPALPCVSGTYPSLLLFIQPLSCTIECVSLWVIAERPKPGFVFHPPLPGLVERRCPLAAVLFTVQTCAMDGLRSDPALPLLCPSRRTNRFFFRSDIGSGGKSSRLAVGGLPVQSHPGCVSKCP
ncbi:NF-kappa-B inhibitor zeta-like isoform X1 [Conger conger]|uniref:NF-kappa-B inhibitor zeta-like isoform X1 n=1 Tax=Conger conger TaxID=82655 RepID=UPI002A5B0E82|nr:NF-kappa-B inhibitor zeta-like isoform X1 [Conger conger]